LHHLAEYPSAKHNYSIQVRALDLNVDSSPRANALLKQTRLLDDGNHSGDFF
jgi:hypothetical protein